MTAESNRANLSSSWAPTRVTNSWLSRIGCSRRMRRAASAVGLSTSASAPSSVCMLVTDFSRMESSGGLVTCAKRWAK